MALSDGRVVESQEEALTQTDGRDEVNGQAGAPKAGRLRSVAGWANNKQAGRFPPSRAGRLGWQAG